MHGIGFDIDLQDWFDFNIPKTTIHPNYIANCLTSEESLFIKPSAKIVWLGSEPLVSYTSKTKRGNTLALINLAFHSKNDLLEISFEKEKLLLIAALVKD